MLSDPSKRTEAEQQQRLTLVPVASSILRYAIYFCMVVMGLQEVGVDTSPILAGAGLLGLAAIPFLPSSFTDRMETIQGYQADQSANTRLAVWAWTLDYVQTRPFGGGFEAYRQNRINVQTVAENDVGEVAIVRTRTEADEGRAWHSAYFEMLGEQGWPGLFLFLLIHGIGLARMELLRRRYRNREGDMAWVSPLATALQHFQLVYLVGGLFVAVAWQPFIWMAIAVQIGFDRLIARRERDGKFAFAKPDKRVPATI